MKESTRCVCLCIHVHVVVGERGGGKETEGRGKEKEIERGKREGCVYICFLTCMGGSMDVRMYRIEGNFRWCKFSYIRPKST